MPLFQEVLVKVLLLFLAMLETVMIYSIIYNHHCTCRTDQALMLPASSVPRMHGLRHTFLSETHTGPWGDAWLVYFGWHASE